MLFQKLFCFFDRVRNPLSWWLTSRPQFQVFYPVVASYAVYVVNIFMAVQRTAKMLLHDKTMLERHSASLVFASYVTLWVRFPFPFSIIRALSRAKPSIPVAMPCQIRVSDRESFLTEPAVNSGTPLCAHGPTLALMRAELARSSGPTPNFFGANLASIFGLFHANSLPLPRTCGA